MESIEPVTGEFLLGLGANTDSLKLEDDTEIVLVFEGPSKTELLEEPGLRVSRPGLPDMYTGGVGLFIVHERSMLVERVAGDSSTPVHLRITVGPPNSTWELISTDDAVMIGLKAFQEQGIGYSHFNWSSEGHKLTLLARLDDDPVVGIAVVDRYRGTLESLIPFQVPNIFGMTNKSAVEQMMNQVSHVEFLTGDPQTRTQLALVERLFASCAKKDYPTTIDVRVTEGSTEFDYEFEENSRLSRQHLEKCLNEVFAEWEFSPATFRIHLTLRRPAIAEFFAGESPKNLEATIKQSPRLFVKINKADVSMRNQIRRAARLSWHELIACGNSRTTVDATVLRDGTLSKTTSVPCLKAVLDDWTFEPPSVEQDLSFDLKISQ